MATLEELIDQTPPGGSLTLAPANSEFQGPAVIGRPITVYGQGGTISAKSGPVIVVQANDVVLNDVNIEVTGKESGLDRQAYCALAVEPGKAPKLNNVSVRGNVVGVDQEEGEWRYPRSLRFRKIKAGQPHEFKVRLFAPVPCQFHSEIDCLTIHPANVNAGLAELLLNIEALAPGTRLRGKLSLCSASLTRWISVTGNATRTDEEDGKIGTGQVHWEPRDQKAATPSRSSRATGPGKKQPAKGSPEAKEAEVVSKPALRKREKPTASHGGSIPQKLPSEPPTSRRKPVTIPDAFAEERQEDAETPIDSHETKQASSHSQKTSSIPVTSIWTPSANEHPEETPPEEAAELSPPELSAAPNSDAVRSESVETVPVGRAVVHGATKGIKKRPRTKKSKPIPDFFGAEPASEETDTTQQLPDETVRDDEEPPTGKEAEKQTASTTPRKKRKIVKPNTGTSVFGQSSQGD